MPLTWLKNTSLKRNCFICEKEYIVTSPRQCACLSCKDERKKRRFAEYYKQNKEVVRARAHIADKTEKGKQRYKRYRLNDRYREYARLRYHLLPENIKKARYFIHNAVRDKRIVKLDYCEECGRKDWGTKRSMIEAHHYLGYEEVNWLKVRWLCTDCHKMAEKGGTQYENIG